MDTKVNPASAGMAIFREVRAVVRRASFHVRAWALGFEIRHGLPVI